MRCLVTGASGFLGSHLVRRLLKRDHSLTVLLKPGSDLSRIQDSLPFVRTVYGSLEDVSALSNALALEPVDAAFHLAWAGVTSDFRNNPEQITRNVSGALNIWDLLQKTGCKTWVGLGSQAEYGPYAGVLDEATPPSPVTAYGMAKLTVGRLTAQLCSMSGMRHVWLRLLSAYGPGDDHRHMIPTVIRALLRGGKPSLTAGEQVWDYLYVGDAAEALGVALERDAKGVFVLSSGQTTTIRSAVELLRDYINPSAEVGFGDVPYASDQVMRLEADTTRLQTETGWRPTTDLKTGLQQTVDWHRSSDPGSAAGGPEEKTVMASNPEMGSKQCH
jgi:UDP-glucose 4-epimerase